MPLSLFQDPPTQIDGSIFLFLHAGTAKIVSSEKDLSSTYNLRINTHEHD